MLPRVITEHEAASE
jgi:hypothetical protein